MLPVGVHAPSFNVKSASGEEKSLEELLRDGPLILFFYPADFSAVCTREVCLFRDQYEQLSQLAVGVVGVSPQGERSHARFRERRQLPYPLVADQERQLIERYDVAGPFGFVRRVTYLISPEQRIQYRTLADLRLRPHQRLIDETLRLYAAHQGARAAAEP